MQLETRQSAFYAANYIYCEANDGKLVLTVCHNRMRPTDPFPTDGKDDTPVLILVPRRHLG
jgi:hypothetical protein